MQPLSLCSRGAPLFCSCRGTTPPAVGFCWSALAMFAIAAHACDSWRSAGRHCCAARCWRDDIRSVGDRPSYSKSAQSAGVVVTNRPGGVVDLRSFDIEVRRSALYSSVGQVNGVLVAKMLHCNGRRRGHSQSVVVQGLLCTGMCLPALFFICFLFSGKDYTLRGT